MSEEENEFSINEAAASSVSTNQQNNELDSRSQSGRLATSRFSWEAVSVLLLVIVLIVGAYFRFTGLDWDGNHHLHPDERFLTIVATSLKTVSDPLSYLRTSTSPLNPYNIGQSFYVYGNFPMTVTRYLAEWVDSACSFLTPSGMSREAGAWQHLSQCNYFYTAYDGIHLLGRFLSGLMDLVSIVFTFLIGRRLYDWRTGLLAALLLAMAVMPIQQSHFFTMDNWAAALTTMTLYTAVRAASLGDENPLWQARWYALFGLGLGLATASRINVAPLALMIGVSAFIWLLRRNEVTVPSLKNVKILGGSDFQRVLGGIALAAIISIITFRIAQPYAFTDFSLAREQQLAQTGQEPSAIELAVRSVVGFNSQWLSNMEQIQLLQAPEASFPPALQWTDRAPILFPLTNMILYGMGLTAGLAAVLGFMWALWRLAHFRSDWMSHAIPIIWSGFYFLFIGTRWVKSVRYFLPIYPMLLLLAAWALIALWDRAKRSDPRSHSSRAATLRLVKQALAGLLIIVVVVPSFLWANAFVNIYQRPVTRVAASNWIFDNVPSGASLLYTDLNGESHEFNLPLKEFLFLSDGIPLTLNFNMPEDGTITSVRFNYLIDSDYAVSGADAGETFHLRFNGEEIGEQKLDLDDRRQSVLISLPPTPVSSGTPQKIIVELGEGGPVLAGTSILANEHWDDLLPVSTGSRNAYGKYYKEVSGGQRPVTNPDSPRKLRELITWLDEADYIMLSSQRALWHLARLPLTYPLMMRYYETLFNGELGFELVHQEHADLHIGPLIISDTTGQVKWDTGSFFKATPEVGWPPPGDLAAEEAFSVYDHPPVWIFRKTDNYSHDNTTRLLKAVDLSQVISMNPLEATQAPNGLLLSGEDQIVQQTNGTFNSVFDVDGLLSQHPALAAVIWWLAVILLGWLAFPLAFVTLHGLPDRGYALARILSLLIVSYLAWLLASLKWLPHTRATLWLAVLSLGLTSLVIFLSRRHEILTFVKRNLGLLFLIELLGVFLFALQIGIRLGNPDVWHILWGGEKPMDLSYFTAVLKSTTFPPYDPWFAGGYINYYYYGFVYVGALTKLLGVVPALAYNLILPMLFSFTGLGVFSIAYNLVAYREGGEETPQAGRSAIWAVLSKKALVAGFIAITLAILVGNLAEIGVVLNASYRAGAETLENLPLIGALLRTMDGSVNLLRGEPAPIYPSNWFWTATRAINYLDGETAPITEFPFFTFLYGDLHAHMISLPLQVLALGWSVALALQQPIAGFKSATWWETVLQWLVGGLVIGALRATNTWDWPTYLVIGSLAVAFHEYRQHGHVDASMLAQTIVKVVALVGLSTITFWPFTANYGVGYTSASVWPGSYTHVGNYLTIYGLFLFLIVTFLLLEFRSWTKTWTTESLKRLEPVSGLLLLLLVLYLILLVLLILRGYWIAPLVLTLIISAGLLGLRSSIDPARRVVLILISAALGLTLMVEFFVLEGDIGRMNTVFKFYMQVWIILSVAGGIAAVWSWNVIRQRHTSRRVWQTALLILFLLAALYPFLATQAKWQVRMSQDAPHTLDGMAFMPYAQYSDTNYAGESVTISLADDYEALRWMQRNVEGSPVVAEAHSGNPYRSIANRVTMYTGLPAIVGWSWHQRQQRTVVPRRVVTDRIRDVSFLYNTPDIDQAQKILNKYGVSYVYVGELERSYYWPEGIAKFEQMARSGVLEVAYQNETVTVYKVKDQSAS